MDALFSDARKSLGRVPANKPTREAILHAARQFFHELEVKALPVTFLEREARADRLELAIDEAAAIAASAPSDLQPVAKRVAARAGIALQDGTVADLAQALHAAMIEHAGRQVERLEEVAVLERNPVFVGIGPDRAPPAPRMTLAQAIKSYSDTPERRHLTERTHAAVAQRLALWSELLGADTAIGDVTRAAIREARDVVIRLPAHAPKKWRGTPLQEVVLIAERKGIPAQSPKNATNSVITLAALFAWAAREGHISKSPATGLGRIEHIGHREKPRRPFTVEELNRFLSSATYRAPVWGLQQWAPLLSLFGGFRAGEVIGLHRDDVIEVDGVAAIHVRPRSDRRFKTDQSERIVPIHPQLVAAGFVAWVYALPADGPPHLFADRADAVDASQKRLSRAVRASFKAPALVFHSFRHTWVDALRAACVPVEIAERLGGWRSVGSARLGYGSGHRPAQLATELEKVSYPGLELTACPR